MNEKFKPSRPEKPKSAEDIAFDELDREFNKEEEYRNQWLALDAAIDELMKDEKVNPAIMKLMIDEKRASEEWKKQSVKVREALRKLGKAIRNSED